MRLEAVLRSRGSAQLKRGVPCSNIVNGDSRAFHQAWGLDDRLGCVPGEVGRGGIQKRGPHSSCALEVKS